MPKITYKQKRLSQDRLNLIDLCNEIIGELLQQGYKLTLRQLYYQLVSRAEIENTDRSYKRLGTLVTDARMGGLMDWSAIEDRTRRLKAYSSVDDAQETLQNAAAGHCLDLWEGQDYRIEVWVEKDALSEVVEKAVQKYRVPVMVCRGYMSISAMWRAGRERFKTHNRRGLRTAVIHLGDHDPSGVDMSRDIEERISLFSGYPVEVDRIALSMEQVEQYRPPPNPTKLSDSRAAEYIAEYGHESWELDALEPKTLDALIKEAILKRLDVDQYKEMLRLESEQEDQLGSIADNYEDVLEFLENRE